MHHTLLYTSLLRNEALQRMTKVIHIAERFTNCALFKAGRESQLITSQRFPVNLRDPTSHGFTDRKVGKSLAEQQADDVSAVNSNSRLQGIHVRAAQCRKLSAMRFHQVRTNFAIDYIAGIDEKLSADGSLLVRATRRSKTPGSDFKVVWRDEWHTSVLRQLWVNLTTAY